MNVKRQVNPYTLAKAQEMKIISDVEKIKRDRLPSIERRRDVLNYLRTLETSIRILTLLHSEKGGN